MINENETIQTTDGTPTAQTHGIQISQEPSPSQAHEVSISISTAEPVSPAVSISPSITEIERFIKFLSNKHGIKPFNNLVVLIQKTEPQVKGYYSPNSWKAQAVFKHQEQETEPSNINEITLSSINLLFEPYETIAHEFAHFLNTHLDGYKGNSRNYHTADFKKRAEQMGLRVEKGKYGFNQTYETDEFKQIIAEFKPSPTAFKLFQPTDSRIVGIDGNGKPYGIDKDGNRYPIEPQPKGKSRLLLFSCSCNCKIRTARNEDKPLKAKCSYCNTEFKEVIKTPKAEPVSPAITISPAEPSEDEPSPADEYDSDSDIKARGYEDSEQYNKENGYKVDSDGEVI